jgi:geranylgeranyl diphosphate synthase, type II
MESAMATRPKPHLPDVLKEIADRVTDRLEALLAPPDPDSKAIYEAMRYSVMAGGKRFRPALVILTSQLLGANDADALPAACAIEMVHTYSLVHDDLPAMDDDDLRRGRPTSHKVFGEAMAILAGDALLTEAFAVLAGGSHSDSRTVRLVRELAAAAGAVGMVGGQVADLDAERNPDSAVEVELIHQRKTARMIQAAVNMGAIVGGALGLKAEALDGYGRHLGLAFQIADDVLDAEGTTEELGKTAGKDAAHGKRTYVSVYGLDEAQRRAKAELNAALNAITEFGPAADPLRDLARFCVERRA